MRWRTAFVVVLASVMLALSSAPFVAVSAQTNCHVTAQANFVGPHRVAIFPAGTPITDVVTPSAPGPISAVINVPYAGPAQWQIFSGGNWIFVTGVFQVNCNGQNGELIANTSCDTVGVDLTLQPTGSYLVKVFKNGQPFSQQTFTPTAPFSTHELTLTTAPIDPADQYTYEVRCQSAGGCGFGSAIPNNALVSQGALVRKCDSPCGPSLAGKPLGLMTVSVPFHWAPQAGAASTFIAEAGKTFKVLRTSGDFTEVVLACKAYWVPSNAIRIVGN